jgi:hypothetical protein
MTRVPIPAGASAFYYSPSYSEMALVPSQHPTQCTWSFFFWVKAKRKWRHNIKVYNESLLWWGITCLYPTNIYNIVKKQNNTKCAHAHMYTHTKRGICLWTSGCGSMQSCRYFQGTYSLHLYPICIWRQFVPQDVAMYLQDYMISQNRMPQSEQSV